MIDFRGTQDQSMTNLRTIQRVSLIAIFASLSVSAQVSTSTVNISITPNDTLTNIYFLYAQGDVSNFSALYGTAPANVTTQFTVNMDVGLPIPGVPYFSVIGVYTPDTGPSGIYVATDDPDAANLRAIGESFDTAFPSFVSGAIPENESTLIASMENPNSPAPAPGGGFALFGYEVISSFADTPEQQAPALFSPLNLTGITNADLVKFSDARIGGAVQVSVQGTGQAAVPEPRGVWLFGAAVLAVWAGRGIRNNRLRT